MSQSEFEARREPRKAHRKKNPVRCLQREKPTGEGIFEFIQGGFVVFGNNQQSLRPGERVPCTTLGEKKKKMM